MLRLLLERGAAAARRIVGPSVVGSSAVKDEFISLLSTVDAAVPGATPAFLRAYDRGIKRFRRAARLDEAQPSCSIPPIVASLAARRA
jgi:hypothetical protein